MTGYVVDYNGNFFIRSGHQTGSYEECVCAPGKNAEGEMGLVIRNTRYTPAQKNKLQGHNNYAFWVVYDQQYSESLWWSFRRLPKRNREYQVHYPTVSNVIKL